MNGIDLLFIVAALAVGWVAWELNAWHNDVADAKAQRLIDRRAWEIIHQFEAAALPDFFPAEWDWRNAA